MSDYPVVRIECPDGAAWKSTVTIDGVMIPCTSITWTADNMNGVARAVLEVPRVLIDVKVKEALAKVVEVNTTAPDAAAEDVPSPAQPITVNVSGPILGEADILKAVEKVLRKYGLGGSYDGRNFSR